MLTLRDWTDATARIGTGDAASNNGDLWQELQTYAFLYRQQYAALNRLCHAAALG